jgi:hypothetical protein
MLNKSANVEQFNEGQTRHNVSHFNPPAGPAVGGATRILPVVLLLLTSTLAGCRWHRHRFGERRPLTPAQAAVVAGDVRAFAHTVERDVTRQGPAAWSMHFENVPDFFMVVNGQMAFASGAAAMTAVPSVAAQYKQITLQWGEDLRVDPLTADLAVFAAPYHESMVTAGGHSIESNGYFTGVAEARNGSWKFRDAHWSEAPAALPAAKTK